MRPGRAVLTAALCAACALSARAADLSEASAWLNVAAPLSGAALRGKVAALAFGDDHTADGRLLTRELQATEARLGPGFAPIGVRSALAGEAAESVESLRLDLLRRDVDFPVVVDSSGAVAAAYGVKARPTVILLGVDGAEAARFEGPGHADELLAQAQRLVSEARERGSLDAKPLPLSLERDHAPVPLDQPLLFPTQLFYDAALDRLFVADTGHNRVAVLNRSGRKKDVVGAWAPIYEDGPFDRAGFAHPEGVAVSGSDLFVADTGDGLIRRAFLNKRDVITYASGKVLRSPRGLAVASGTLYIADPGEHALDAVELSRGHFFRFAGTGRAGKTDGMLATAQLDQPSALAAGPGVLWIADGASLRSLSLDAPEIKTLSLSGPAAPLVRPAALAVLGDAVLVADAGDGRIKRVEPKTGVVTVFADGLLQPSGLAVVRDEVVVADTGRSRLLRYAADGRLEGELRVKGLKTPPPGPPLSALPLPDKLTLPAQTVRSGAQDSLDLTFELPAGYHLNPKAPVVYLISETRGRIRVVKSTRKGVVLEPRQPIRILFDVEAEKAEVILNVDFYYCREDNTGPCLSAAKRYEVPVVGSPSERSRRASVVLKP